ncbi:MAG: hypothetical protein AAGJ38_00405 [Planctomycetota bacterium]
MDSRGDRVLNYAAAGYREGTALPDVESIIDPSRFVTVAPTAGNNRAALQAAIDQVSGLTLNADGYRGVVQLMPGQYDIDDTLFIRASGVVLRGVGDGADPASNSILHSTTTRQITMVQVESPGINSINLGSTGLRSDIIDKVVPSGATSFRVADPDAFAVGEWVNVYRDASQAWLDRMMSAYPEDPDGDNWGWTTDDQRYDHQQERRITRIEGDRVFIHAPIAHSIDSRVSTGTIQRYPERRISHVGIEGIRGTTVFDASETGVASGRPVFTDSDHAQDFIAFQEAKDSWARDVTGQHLSGSAVRVTGISRSITVKDSSYVDPVSPVTGGQRYAFNLNGGQFILMEGLEVDSARRAFINNSTFNGFNRGPNVFLDSTATNSFVHSGPHAGYSTGALYDNVRDDDGVEARRAFSPIVHGWRGGNAVFWNVVSPEFQLSDPPDSRNYSIGGTGGVLNISGEGATVDSHGTRIDFNDPENPLNSLYVAQVLEAQRNPGVQRREYWVGDFDEFEADGPGSADEVYVDPAWRTEVENITGFRAGYPIAGFDDPDFDRLVPFSIGYHLAEDERVVSAVLTIGTKRLGNFSDNDVVFLESLGNRITFGTREAWGMEFDDGLQVVSIELFGDVSYLQDGLLNVLVTDDRPVDWAHLALNIGPAILEGDFNGSGSVEQGDLNLVLSNWGNSVDAGPPAGWIGDPPEGSIDQNELNRVLGNWGNSSVPPDVGTRAVPEPGLGGLGVLLLSTTKLRNRPKARVSRRG